VARKPESSRWTLETWSGSTKDYNSVILATPYHSSDIRLSSNALNDSTLLGHIPTQPYVHLHVTLLTTTSPHPNPTYFGLAADAKDVPTAVLTSSSGARVGGAEPEFNSLTYHGLVRGEKGTETEGEEKEWAVKLFSKERISDEWLRDMFMGKVGWVYRKEVCILSNAWFQALIWLHISGMHTPSYLRPRSTPP
jgi:prenylcysteine oxidase/farnesylcysteine lyase